MFTGILFSVLVFLPFSFSLTLSRDVPFSRAVLLYRVVPFSRAVPFSRTEGLSVSPSHTAEGGAKTSDAGVFFAALLARYGNRVSEVSAVVTDPDVDHILPVPNSQAESIIKSKVQTKFNPPDLVNVALNKPATQSSYHPTYGHPERAVDGGKGGNIAQCTHTADTDSHPNRWWRVDLEGHYEVQAVVITNRGDCCGYRLADFDIIVSKEPFDPFQRLSDPRRRCLHQREPVGEGATVRLECPRPIVGRYVTLILHTTKWPLNFCEMEVLAPAVPSEDLSVSPLYTAEVGAKTSDAGVFFARYGNRVSEVSAVATDPDVNHILPVPNPQAESVIKSKVQATFNPPGHSEWHIREGYHQTEATPGQRAVPGDRWL